MVEKNKTLLVTGATGTQGSAVVKSLLEAGWSVRGLTRNPNGNQAQALAELGAEMVAGDLSDRSSLDQALTDIYGVYSFPNMTGGLEAEVEQGKTMADAARAAGIEHFVQASVGGVERNSGVPHFESKWQIEEYVRSRGLPATFLRPVFFMENFFWKRDQILNGSYESMGMNPDKPLQIVAADDIGAMTAIIFDNPDQFIGQGVELAGDEMTEPEMVAIMSRVIGRDITMTPAGPPMNEDMGKMVTWFNEHGYEAAIPALRAIHPEFVNTRIVVKQNRMGKFIIVKSSKLA